MKKRGLNLPKQRTYKNYASVFKRITAFIIDLLIINLFILSPFKNLFDKLFPKEEGFKKTYEFLVTNQSLNNLLFTITAAATVMTLLYFVIMEYKLNQTLGKMIMNIYVVSETKKFTIWHAFLRSLFIIPFFPFILLWIIDPIYLIYTKGQKRLSEVFSKTKTIEIYVM